MPKKYSPSELSVHHSLVTGGRKLQKAVRSLPDCQACRIGAIAGKSSRKRGVSVENNGLGVLIEFHSDNGIQQFTASPVKGASLAGLADAVVEMLTRRGYVILNGGKKMEQLPEPKPIAVDNPDLATAYRAVLATVEVGENGVWRSKSAYNAVGKCFQRKDANRIFGLLRSRKVLIKDEETTKKLGIVRPGVYFVQKVEVMVPDFEIKWPEVKKEEGRIDVSAVLAQNPGLIKEALLCLWQSRADKASLLKGEMSDLDKEIAELEKAKSAKQREATEAEKEAEDLERMILALEKG